MRIRTLIWPTISLWLGGCALLAAPAVEQVGSLANMAGTGATGMVGTQSTVAVNKSWILSNDAQARYTQAQSRALHRQHDQELSRQSTAVGILRNMATLQHDPRIADLARFVQNGGDPQFALDHALSREQEDSSRAETVRILRDMSENEHAPQLYELARWVQAGGDQQFAINYALTQAGKSNALTKAITPPVRPDGAAEQPVPLIAHSPQL
ncbi:MAG TPA: hypothetical protein VKV28_14815 [Candidatus Binataceae bacterium]|nr:hypothetical protein [Candidatus Binataceae bacterium]